MFAKNPADYYAVGYEVNVPKDCTSSFYPIMFRTIAGVCIYAGYIYTEEKTRLRATASGRPRLDSSPTSHPTGLSCCVVLCCGVYTEQIDRYSVFVELAP